MHTQAIVTAVAAVRSGQPPHASFLCDRLLTVLQMPLIVCLESWLSGFSCLTVCKQQPQLHSLPLQPT